MVDIALVGCGHWGRNVLRTLASESEARVIAVIDPDPEAQRFAASFGVALHASTSALPALGADAVVIATPGSMHARHTLAALACKAHVFVEKPMAMSVAEAGYMTSEAARRGLVGMVGHLLHHHPAVRAMQDQARAGAIGRLQKLTSVRASARGSRDAEGSVLWSLAPHDISLMLAIDPGPVTVLGARSRADRAAVSMELQTAHGLLVSLQVSRASDHKVRRIELEGDRGKLVLNDTLPAGKLQLLARGQPPCFVPYEEAEPLREEMREFLRCVRDRRLPFTCFEEGLAVVTLLDQVAGSLDSARSSPPAFAAR
jgi:predicted dehydrogenase